MKEYAKKVPVAKNTQVEARWINIITQILYMKDRYTAKVRLIIIIY